MKYWVLESGSKGNCSVVESNGQFLIIDCGGSKKYLESCFESIGLNYLDALALLVTHEHSDHIKQINMFKDLRVYAPCEILSLNNEVLIEAFEEFEVGCFKVMPIPLSHDTEKTVGYMIYDGEEIISIITDTGYLSHECQEMIANSTYYIFESNYDTEMLMNSSRPAYLKYRIISDDGHMSNDYSSKVLSYLIGNNTKEIVLAHISQECNTPELALSSLITTLESNNIDPEKYRIHVAEQFGMYKGGQ